MTKDQHAARQLIGNWLAKQKIKLTQPMHHVCPRGYVLARPAFGPILVAVPHMDCEPQIVALNSSSQFIHTSRYDRSITLGDWVATAYIVTPQGGESIAVAWPKPAKPVHS